MRWVGYRSPPPSPPSPPPSSPSPPPSPPSPPLSAKCYCWSNTGGSGYLRDKDCKGKPSNSYAGLHRKVFEMRQHPDQRRTHKVHAIVPIDKDPWTWRMLTNVQAIAQVSDSTSKRARFATQIPPRQEQRIWQTIRVNPSGGVMQPGTCSTLEITDEPMFQEPKRKEPPQQANQTRLPKSARER